jgi:hypothetical protein
MTVDISQNALQRSWQPFFPLRLQLCMVSMEQNVAAKDQGIQTSKKPITVVKKSTYDQEYRYWGPQDA